MLLEQTNKYRAETEVAAKDMIEQFRKNAEREGYIVKKAGYEYKTKKAKKEIIGEVWVVSVTLVFAGLWEDLE